MLSSDAEIINLPISDGRAGFLGQNIFDKDNKLIEAPLKSRDLNRITSICGYYTEDARALYDCNIKTMFSICNGPMSLGELMKNTARLIEIAT